MSTFRHNGCRRYRGRWVEDIKLQTPSAIERIGRRATRKLGIEDLLFEPDPETRAARGNGDLRGARRMSGRWVRPSHQPSARWRLARQVAARSWYLIIPLLGFAWANATYVRPEVENRRSQQNIERQLMLDRQDDMRAEIARLQSETVEIGALIDTLRVPEIRIQQIRLDSLLLVRRATERDPAVLQARLDSLQTFRGYLLAQLAEGRTQAADLTAQSDRLALRHQATQDSLAQLEQLLATNVEALDRRAGRRNLHGVVSRFWYLVAPMVGMMWAHDS